jgi:hypothetical protein
MKREPENEAEIKPSNRPVSTIFASKGVYLAFLPLNDREMSLYLLNNTDWEIPFTLGEETGSQYKGLTTGLLKRKTSLRIKELVASQFENWPVFVIQLLFHKEGAHTLPAPMVRKMRFRTNTFFKSKQKAPLLDQEAHLFQIDIEHVDIQPEKIMDKIQNQASSSTPVVPLPKPASTIDLHIEQLRNDFAGMSKNEMLKVQLEAFEKNLENAIASGMHDITFIHGLGNGTLRTELHKRLGRHLHVQYFEDAQKEKFGYGATKVTIK